MNYHLISETDSRKFIANPARIPYNEKSNMNENSEKDFSEQYGRTLKAFRPWVISILLWIVIFFGGFIYIVTSFDAKYLLVFFVIMCILAIPSGRAILKASRCPSCKRFMGRDVGNFCPICGVRIRREK